MHKNNHGGNGNGNNIKSNNDNRVDDDEILY